MTQIFLSKIINVVSSLMYLKNHATVLKLQGRTMKKKLTRVRLHEKKLRTKGENISKEIFETEAVGN